MMAAAYSQEFSKVTYQLQKGMVPQTSFAESPSDFEWGDYDGDGDLDLIISGQLNATGDFGTKIWRNDGNHIFYDIRANIMRLHRLH